MMVRMPLSLLLSIYISISLVSVPRETISNLHYVTNSAFKVVIPNNILITGTVNINWLFNGNPLEISPNDTTLLLLPGYHLYFDPFVPQNHSGFYQLVCSNPLQAAIVYVTELKEAGE